MSRTCEVYLGDELELEKQWVPRRRSSAVPGSSLPVFLADGWRGAQLHGSNVTFTDLSCNYRVDE
jgi:hypothetical protein